MDTMVSASMASCLTYFSIAMWIRDSYSALPSTPYFLNSSRFFLAFRTWKASTESRRFGRPRRAASSCHSSE